MNVSSAVSADNEISSQHNCGESVASIMGKDSLINSLVQSGEWETLFKDEQWLSALKEAQKLNMFNGDLWRKNLLTIAHYFPEETKEYLMPELL